MADISTYKNFVEETLLPRKLELEALHAVKAEELAAYGDFLAIARSHDGFPDGRDYCSALDIGSDVWVQCRAQASEIRREVYTHAGFGFHVPLPLDEALLLASARAALLTRRLGLLEAEMQRVEADIAEAQGLLRELAESQ